MIPTVMRIMALLSVFGWTFFFGLGTFISSKTYIVRLNNGTWDWWDFAICLCTYTPTCCAVLTCSAAFAGGCASRLLNEGNEKEIRNRVRARFLLENPLSSMLRGFAVYLSFLAGVSIGSENAFAEPTQAQFIRIAGIISLLAFAVGYDPLIFNQFLNRFRGNSGNQADGDSDKAPVAGHV